MNMSIRFPKKYIINSVNPSFSDMWEGKKTFEVLFDPDIKKHYAVDDELVFIEHDFTMRSTGRTLRFKINYIFTPDYLLQGFIIASLTKI
jgi:hypothetical protein